MNKRMTFEQFFDKMAWLIITGVGVYASTQLRTMSENISDLKTNTAVLIERVGTHSTKLDNHEGRINVLENH